MANYRQNADANRNALFGSSPTPVSSTTRRSKAAATTNNTTMTTKYSSQNNDRSAAIRSTSIAAAGIGGATSTATLPSSHRRSRPSPTVSTLTGQARIDKLQEAQEYQKKAKKALQKTLFSSPDPVSGAMFYHRAAEAYKQCGEWRLERLHRMASAECHMSHGAFAIAAGEYIRAAELIRDGGGDDINEIKSLEERRRECSDLYANASKAWREEGEMGRAAECMLQSGYALLMSGKVGGEQQQGHDIDDDELVVLGGQRLMGMNRDAMTIIEAAVEMHVPDPLNRYHAFRQTGISSFVDPEEEPTDNLDALKEETTRSLCLAHMVKTSFAHEAVSRAVEKFAEYGEYKSALYAAGAVTALLEQDGFSTISLSRAYCVETILALAIGDVVAADKYFLQVHLQNNNYLTSRECKLAEDLIRAVKMRNEEDLDVARDPNGENRAALSNLQPVLRNVVATLRISGVAKSMVSSSSNNNTVGTNAKNVNLQFMDEKKIASKPGSTSSRPISNPEGVQHDLTDDGYQGANIGEKLDSELDDLMKDMGLGSDEIGGDYDDNDDDDDDIDLR